LAAGILLLCGFFLEELLTKLEILKAYIRNDCRNISDMTKGYTNETTKHRVVTDCILHWFVAKQLCDIDYHFRLDYLIALAQGNLYDVLIAVGFNPELEVQRIIDESDLLVDCPNCNGNGGWYYYEWESCRICGGTGKVKEQ
jgi:hypothetical protein